MSIITSAAPSGSLRFSRNTTTFTGAANLGANGTSCTHFTVTGECLILALVPYCTSTLTQSGATPTISLGVTGATAFFIALTTATNIATGEFWTEATGGNTANAAAYLPAAGTSAPQLKDIAITANILTTVGGTNNVNGGTLRFDCWWLPLSSDGNIA